MIDVTIRIDTSKFDRAMADLPEALARAKRAALIEIGNTVKNQAIGSFKNPALRPSPWAPRKNNVDPGRPLLYKKGNMKGSIDDRLQGTDTVVIGTPHEYAKYHQRGTKNMPARPFFPVDGRGRLMPDVKDAIVRKVQNAYSAELQKAFGNGGG